jgi:hypothetical protein
MTDENLDSIPPIVADDRSSIPHNIFPSEVFRELGSLYFSIKQSDLWKILGDNFPPFNNILYKIIIPETWRKIKRPEFYLPVVPLSYYNLLFEKHPDDIKAIKLHGLCHAFMGLKYPEYRYWWRRIVDMIGLVLDKGVCSKDVEDHILKIGLIIQSLHPVEEMVATYLRDYRESSRSRRIWLEYFGRRNLKNNNEWPYIVAYKSIYALHGVGFDDVNIEEIIRLCNYQVNLHEIGEAKSDHGYLSGTPYLINILKNVEEISEGKSKIEKFEIIDGILKNPVRTKSLESLSNIQNFLKEFKLFKGNEFPSSEKLWDFWKKAKIYYFQTENNISLSTLYCIADYIVSSPIIMEYGKSYEVIIPKMTQTDISGDEKRLLVEILILIRFLMLKLYPLTSNAFKLNFRDGDKIEAFGEEFIFPKIEIDYKRLKNLHDEVDQDVIAKINDKLTEFAIKSKIFRKNYQYASLHFLKNELSNYVI